MQELIDMETAHSVVYIPEQDIQFQLQCDDARFVLLLSSRIHTSKTPTLILFPERRRRKIKKEEPQPSLVFAATAAAAATNFFCFFSLSPITCS